MSKDLLYQQLSEALYNAQASHQAIPALTDSHNLTPADGYRIQLLNIERYVKEGRVISGKKIGLTSKGMQDMFGVNEPDYGHLFADVYYPDGIAPISQFLQPKVEGELAFVLKEDLPLSGVTSQMVLDKTAYVVPAFEIVDSRIADWKIKLPDTIADNASFGGYVLGKVKIDPKVTDLKAIEMTMLKNGDVYNQGKGSDVLGDPAYCVAWLANKMGEFGIALKAGEIVLSGAFAAAPVAAHGDVFVAKFIGLEDVECRFE
ncbi:MAG: fumarylacetoacetate hydrolase family protein [Erysipelotrichaceae bacterium]|jgi:2-keto-4-pentenoate hydratase|nr:fumarylacetoacetate hydrolase family protein [Erysipelotrichaceae bacterium]